MRRSGTEEAIQRDGGSLRHSSIVIDLDDDLEDVPLKWFAEIHDVTRQGISRDVGYIGQQWSSFTISNTRY